MQKYIKETYLAFRYELYTSFGLYSSPSIRNLLSSYKLPQEMRNNPFPERIIGGKKSTSCHRVR